MERKTEWNNRRTDPSLGLNREDLTQGAIGGGDSRGGLENGDNIKQEEREQSLTLCKI